jgi:hypothetical protein
VALDLLGKSVGQAREAAHVHPHRQVLALDVGRGGVLGVGLAFDVALLRSDALGRPAAARG